MHEQNNAATNRFCKSDRYRDIGRLKMESEILLNVSDYARVARLKLTPGVLDYYEGGALDEVTLRDNVAAWERLKLYYHVLAGVGR